MRSASDKTKKPKKKVSERSKWEEWFKDGLSLIDVPAPEMQVLFHPVRKWHLDFAWTDIKFAVEIEGGLWIGGRHVNGAGFEEDMEKYNSLADLGWTLVRLSPKLLKEFSSFEMVERIYKRLKGGK